MQIRTTNIFPDESAYDGKRDGRCIVRFSGKPSINGWALGADNMTYGVLVSCHGNDGRRYELLIDRDTIARLNEVARGMAADRH